MSRGKESSIITIIILDSTTYR